MVTQSEDDGAFEAVTSLVPESRGGVVRDGVVALRESLVKDHYGVDGGLAGRLVDDGMIDLDTAVTAMVSEIMRESDHLLGNELVATENGELRDASVVSYKRAEVLEKAIKALQAKGKFDREFSREVDLDSPAMAIIFRYFLGKVRDTFDRVGMADDQADLFFQRFGEETEDWKRELRESLQLRQGVP